MNSVKIGGKEVGNGAPCFIIGEVGINHNGSLETAKKLIDMAVEAGADAVKFQKRTIDVVYTQEELAMPRENPFGTTNGDLKYGLEFDLAGYREIDAYCKEKGILWFASPWDEASVDFLEEFDPPCYKIASASLTDIGLLNQVSSKNRPVIISTGMSTVEEIDRAVAIFFEHQIPLVILHAVSTYPSENEEANLAVINTLKKRYPNYPIGYSGHERGISLSLCAVAMGACVVERHITLDRTMWGSDQAASLEPKGFELMIRDIRVFEEGFGNGEKVVLDREVPIKKKLRRK
ncbi:N-acetylneuraminate synthase [Candidatus Campbellbacteria bacterium RIFCSPLOWO2_01_FULL_34_15]|uniref:N-acetylneuraminate synthase n=2 Tax=Candidatus Campbelliibacteriota TaxID=1752727 RepID=A0A1F5ELW9_9BACT|nr:MAG: N-acetylneuraminate synthase [Candidatus Campbellbacteria bacterium RIFCSPLOWO2_01_FULL_34_15]